MNFRVGAMLACLALIPLIVGCDSTNWSGARSSGGTTICEVNANLIADQITITKGGSYIIKDPGSNYTIS